MSESCNDNDLTIQQAADLLNVSHEYLVKLIDQSVVTATQTGEHRRLRSDEIMTYKKKRDAERREALTELVRFTEDECGGYEELVALDHRLLLQKDIR